jgi:hypothetical protein
MEQKRPWVGLTNEELKKIAGTDQYSDLLKAVAKTVEAALKAKNS